MRLVSLGLLILAISIGQHWAGVPDRPARTRKHTIKEMCQGPHRPDWCREFYADLAYARERRDSSLASPRKEVGKRFSNQAGTLEVTRMCNTQPETHREALR